MFGNQEIGYFTINGDFSIRYHSVYILQQSSPYVTSISPLCVYGSGSNFRIFHIFCEFYRMKNIIFANLDETILRRYQPTSHWSSYTWLPLVGYHLRKITSGHPKFQNFFLILHNLKISKLQMTIF